MTFAAHHGTVDNEDFVEEIADHLERLNGVVAVALGGSRAQGTARPDSDWDFGLYYRGVFHPQSLRGIGWGGYVSEIGEWGGGVFNGGAWLSVDGRRVDVLYRDLDVVEHQLGEARAGRFHIEHLLHHIAGIPSYLVVGREDGPPTPTSSSPTRAATMRRRGRWPSAPD
jgi:predicted nucleotidyltransferase